MITIFIFVSLIALMVFLLVAPDVMNDVMRSQIDPSLRPPPPKYPHFPVIMIFLLGIGLFYQSGRGNAAPHFGQVQFFTNVAAALVLALIGVAACYSPIRFMKAMVTPLKGVPTRQLDERAQRIVEASGRIVGALFLIASSFVTHLVVAAA